jgi:hypothetical protein
MFLLLGEHRTHIVLTYKFIVSLVDGAYMYYVANPTGVSPRAWARLKTLVHSNARNNGVMGAAQRSRTVTGPGADGSRRCPRPCVLPDPDPMGHQRPRRGAG